MKVWILAFLFLFTFTTHAERSGKRSAARTRTGFHFLRFKGGTTDSGTQGMLVGFRTSQYVYDGLSLGVELNAGAPQDGAIVDNNLLYAGATLGWDQTFAKIFMYDFSLMVGYGYGSSQTLGVSGETLAVHPMAGLGVVIVNGYRLGFYTGYLYTPGTSGFSGITFSLRFERKTESGQSKPIDY
jgi:hypothetical protein